MNDKEYIDELEKTLIFMCDVYTKTQDSLAVTEGEGIGGVDDRWFKMFISVPTIQGTQNRHAVDKIGKLRTIRHNREAPKMSFDELYERIKQGREDT